MDKSQDPAVRALAASLGVEGVTYPDTYDAGPRRRGRPAVPEEDRHKTIALSLPPDVSAMLKDDSSANATSVSAYVANLIRAAHDAVRARDPREFFGSILLRLNEAGFETAFINHPQTVSLADLVLQRPIVTVQVGFHIGLLWTDNVVEARDDKDDVRVFFQWIKVWNGLRYYDHFWRQIDVTYWTEDAVVEMVRTTPHRIEPDVL